MVNESALGGAVPDELVGSYRRCRAVNRAAGSTFYWAARLLSRAKRPHVHALYALARYADDIVDEQPVERRARELQELSDRFLADLATGRSDDEVLSATVHTARRFGIEAEAFRRFFRSMEMDLTITSYESWDDLLVYMDGSAAVIGEPSITASAPQAIALATSPPVRMPPSAITCTYRPVSSR